MGLSMAVLGRRAQFTLFLTGKPSLDLVVELKNDQQDYCSHRITNRSAKRGRSIDKDSLKVCINCLLSH